MKYYTKEWYDLMQKQHYTSGMTVVPDKEYTEDEIRAFYEHDLAEEVEYSRSIYRGELPYDPTETIACFRECYRNMLKYVFSAYPAWVQETADKRLLALNRMTERVYQRLSLEETENKTTWKQINAAAEADLAAQKIPPEIRASFRFHDANVLRLEKDGKTVEMLLRDGGYIGGKTPYCLVTFRGVTRYEREKGLVIRKKMGSDGVFDSNVVYLYDELYKTDAGYEVHMLLTGTTELRYVTVACEEIEVQTDITPDFDDLEADMTAVLTDLVGELKPTPAIPVNVFFQNTLYLDYTEKDNHRWLSIIKDALQTAKTFEIHCWNEESEAIALALEYGTFKETDWWYGKVIVGAVTTAFADMLLSQPKPSDIEAANKMTPFFNIFFDNGFQSCHWGTELYNPQEKQ